MNKPPQDFGIPLLTEVIQTPPRVVPAAAPAPAMETEPKQELELAPITHAPITGWLDEEWTRLEQKISERVLTQLLERIDTVLEQRIRASLAASVQQAVDEIKLGLQLTLEEVISDAVAQEIDDLHFSKK